VKDGGGSSNGIMLSGNHCRLTDSAVVGGTYKFFVHLAGTENRMDHCYLAEKTSESPTLQIEVEKQPNHHRIDHNYFGHRPPLGRNGGETMRVGYSWQSMSNSATVVEENLFERCDGEIEIISSKSCGNIYRNNTFLDCAGMLTLRHGNRCVVENNFFLAHHKRGSGGIRVIGEDHKIINNYIDGVAQGGIWITAGIVNSPLKGYFQAKNILIASNTIVDNRGPCLDLNAGYGRSQRTLKPENITLRRNLFSVPADGTLIAGAEGEGFKWDGNVAASDSTGASTVTPSIASQTHIRLLELGTERGPDGLWQPKVAVKSRLAAGCKLIDGRKTLRSLTRAEVGPSWLEK
jgi:poly(beta-D-mannuronate) lyase